MSFNEQLEELWAVTTDEGHTFVDRHGNTCGIRLWLDGHDFFDSQEEATAFMKSQEDEISNMSVVKLTFNVEVTKK